MDGNRAARRVFGLLEPFRRLVWGWRFRLTLNCGRPASLQDERRWSELHPMRAPAQSVCFALGDRFAKACGCSKTILR